MERRRVGGLGLTQYFPSVRAGSLIHLKLKHGWGEQRRVSPMGAIPDIEHVRLISANTVQYQAKFVARSQINHAVAFIETSQPLPDLIPEDWLADGKWLSEWGNPISIEDPSHAKVVISLRTAGGDSPVAWETALDAVFREEPINPVVLADWHGEVDRWAWRDGFSRVMVEALELRASLHFSDGTVRPIGNLAEGPSVLAMLDIGWWERAKTWAYRKLMRKGPGLSIPMRSIEVLEGSAPICWREAWKTRIGNAVPRSNPD